MQINIGYFYFIKDKFFEIIDDKELMKNKENGNKRPCYFCFRSKKYDNIIWFIPVSTKIEKYQKFVDEAFDYMCEYVLIKLYQTHGIINEELLKKFIQKNQNSGFMKLFTTDLEKILNKIIKENRLDFYILERYIIGIFLGAILHQEIIKEERKKELLFELISQLDLASDKENLQGLLEQLEIPFIKNNNLYIDTDIAKKLFIAYQKEIANVNLLQDKEMIKR